MGFETRETREGLFSHWARVHVRNPLPSKFELVSFEAARTGVTQCSRFTPRRFVLQQNWYLRGIVVPNLDRSDRINLFFKVLLPTPCAPVNENSYDIDIGSVSIRSIIFGFWSTRLRPTRRSNFYPSYNKINLFC